jgi:hypothetical protein
MNRLLLAILLTSCSATIDEQPNPPKLDCYAGHDVSDLEIVSADPALIPPECTEIDHPEQYGGNGRQWCCPKGAVVW